jgi:hypothetical protein
LRRGVGRRSRLVFVIIENPGDSAKVALFAGRRRVKRATARNGRTVIAVRYRKLQGRPVRLRHGTQVVARWKVPRDRTAPQSPWKSHPTTTLPHAMTAWCTAL